MKLKSFSFKIKYILTTGILLFQTANIFCFGQEFVHPSIEPLFSTEEISFLNNASETSELSGAEIFLLSLLFSECPLDSQQAQICITKFNELREEAVSSKFMQLGEEERGRAILKLLFRDTLKKYDLNQTRTNIALLDGTYNCVSSAVLYMALAKSCGLEVKGQKTPLHAFCTVYISEEGNSKKRRIDVETTNPYGFNPGSRETIENEVNIKRYYVVPKKNYSNRQEVSDRVFTGLIAGNLCAEYIKTGNYFSAIPLGAARYSLVDTAPQTTDIPAVLKEVRNDFDILPCNYINIRPSSAAEYASMLKWFTKFIDRWGKNDFVQKNMDVCFGNLFVLCFEEKNYPLAESSFYELSPYVSQKQLEKSEESLADILIAVKIEILSPVEQLKILKELTDSTDFTPRQQKRFEISTENAWINILNSHMKNKEFRSGYQDSKNALSSLPKSSTLKKMNQIFYQNCIAQIHNAFAKQANMQNYEEALKILEQGLLDFPDDKTLSKDLADLKKILGSSI